MENNFWTVSANPTGYQKMIEAVAWTINSGEVSFDQSEYRDESDTSLDILDIGPSIGKPLERFKKSIAEEMDLEENDINTIGLEPQDVIYQNQAEGNSDYLVRGRGEHIPLKDNSVNYIVSNYLLPFLDSEDQTEILKEIERVLHPEGGVGLHVEPSRKGRGDIEVTEHWVMDYDSFEKLREDTENFSDYPLTPERGSNRFYSDNRDRLPSGFYDKFRENIDKVF